MNKLPDIDVDFPHDRKDDVIDLMFAKHGPHRAMNVADWKLDLNRRQRLQGSADLSQNAVIESLVQAMILRMNASPRHATLTFPVT